MTKQITVCPVSDLPPGAVTGAGPYAVGNRSSRVRPHARDQSSQSLFLWRSNVAVQPGCQRRQQRCRQWEGFTYHDGEDSFGGQMIFAAT